MSSRTFSKEASLIIVGPAGSGKTALGNRLAELLQMEMYPAGAKFRTECKKMGIDIAQLSSVPKEQVLVLDRETDNYMQKIIGQPLIITARTAAMFAHHKSEQGEISKKSYIAVGVNSSYKVRSMRKYASLKKEWKSGDEPVPSPKVLFQNFQERDADDMARLRFLYRQDYGVRGWDSFYGVPPCDLVLNSERMTINQEVQQVLALLGTINNIANLQVLSL